MDKVKYSLQFITLFIGILMPLLLLTGYVYHLGYVQAFGLDASLVSKDLSEMLVESWYLVALAVIYLLPKFWIPFAFGAFFMGMFLCALCFAIWQRNKGKTWMLLEDSTEDNQGKTIKGLTLWQWKILGTVINDVLSWAMLPVLIVLCFAVVSVFPYQVGRDDALKQIQDHHQYSCAEIEKLNNITLCSQLIDTTDNNNIISQGIMVTANDKRIAIYSNNKVEVFPFLPQYKLSKTSKQPLVETEQKD
ncbi:hypothetical protein A9Q78_07290 [Methylophaga sp. 41_12_T18]|nr:hypothetical protein A9Q78_07290 [Methylophaga sp. 41_12_T18]